MSTIEINKVRAGQEKVKTFSSASPTIHEMFGSTQAELEATPLMGRKPVPATVPAYFEESSWVEAVLASDVHGRALRQRLVYAWGVLSIILSFSVLHLYYDFSPARSFFISTTTITTIGYGPTNGLYDPWHHDDHVFLSIFFMTCVLPFSFFQTILFTDESKAHASHVKIRITKHIRRGVHPTAAFHIELRSTIIRSVIYIGVFILLGFFVYFFFAKYKNVGEGIFYAVTSTTTIGYGSFDLEHSGGYWVAGCYALTCYHTVGVVFSQLAAICLVAAENIQQQKISSGRIEGSVAREMMKEAI
jgi:hypothetical protein